MTLFIADDSALVRERLISMLSTIPKLEIIGVSDNFQDTINSINNLKPDAAILDIRMPGGTGIEILKYFKTKEYPYLKIILTNFPYPQYKKKCYEQGAHYFLNKSDEFYKIIEIFEDLRKGGLFY